MPCTDRYNLYILIYGDQFTKIFEAYALLDQKAVTIDCAFINKVRGLMRNSIFFYTNQ